MVRSGLKLAFLGGVVAAVSLQAAGALGATVRTECSTHGLSPTSAYRVVGLVAQGVPCPQARGVARRLRDELSHGQAVDVPGVQGLSTASEITCTPGCRSVTKVTLTYAHGQVTVTLNGAGSGQAPKGITPPAPQPPGGSPPIIV